MDLKQLIQYLLQTQNRREIRPELSKGETNYNQTPGNPEVQLQDGWLRSLIPYYTGEGGPPGFGQDDGRTRSLEQLLWERQPGFMEQSSKLNNQMDMDLRNGKMSSNELNEFLMRALRGRAQSIGKTKNML